MVSRRVPSPMPSHHWTERLDFVQFDHRPIRPTSSFFLLKHFFGFSNSGFSVSGSTFPKKTKLTFFRQLEPKPTLVEPRDAQNRDFERRRNSKWATEMIVRRNKN